MLAAQEGHVEVVKLLIAAGADVNGHGEVGMNGVTIAFFRGANVLNPAKCSRTIMHRSC
jgi:ankyrin repeat protein